jgi:methylaspartate mutase epsilon subunit
MELSNRRLTRDEFFKERGEVLRTWPTGNDVLNFSEGVRHQREVPDSKRFSVALDKANRTNKTLLQPRAGVALVDEHIELLTYLQDACDVLPTTIDAYTRLNRYEEAANGIARSKAAGTSLLNGFPAVNHGLAECRRLVDALDKPVQVRHGTPDARLLAEITMAAGFTAYEGGGISYNIPYAKKVPLDRSIRHWQYCDRLIGLYEEEGIRIDREPFGPLSGTLVPPFMSHCVAIIEGLLALQQGVKCITLGYGQAGNMVQDVAAITSLRELANEYFREAGFEDYQLNTVFHQWMGGFPTNEPGAFGVICWGAAAAALAGATKVIVKTPHEAAGVPTKEANKQGLEATAQIMNMVRDQQRLDGPVFQREVALIKSEVRAVMRKVFELGEGDVARGAVRAFEAGVMDIPFAPANCNAGKMLPVRDNEGAVRIFEPARVPLPADVMDYHRERLQERATAEGREPTFQMVVDDIYAISKSQLIGRPR